MSISTPKIPLRGVISTFSGLIVANYCFQYSQETPNWRFATEMSLFQFFALLSFWFTARETPNYVTAAAIYSIIALAILNFFQHYDYSKDVQNWHRIASITMFQFVAIFVLWLSVKVIRKMKSLSTGGL